MKKTEIKQGQRFGRLTVIREVEPRVNPKGQKIRMVLCKCDCGKVTYYLSHDKFNGFTEEQLCDSFEELRDSVFSDDMRENIEEN